MAKPDNRQDNEVHLQQHINHTIANLHETENYLNEHQNEISVEEKKNLEAKNDRREESLNAFINEKRDESEH